MILALKPVVQEVPRLFGLSTGLFFTHERNKCRRGRVAVRRGGGATRIFTTIAPVCGLGGGALLMAVGNSREGTSAPWNCNCREDLRHTVLTGV